MKKRSEEQINEEIRGVISMFSEEQPVIVPPKIYKLLEKRGLVPDPRVKVTKEI